MKITKEQIKKLKPCPDGYQWFLDYGSPDLTKTLLDVNKVKPEWAAWLYAKLMSGKQRKQFAIYAAEQVLHIFETEYPNDDRPRKAIAAAKRVLKSNTKANREAAYDAAYDARDAGTAAAAGASDAARDAAYAGAGAAGAAGAYGAYTDAAAGDAAAAYADAAGAAAGTAMREKLIVKAIDILSKK